MWFVVLELTLVFVAITVSFHADAIACVFVPLTLIDPCLAINHDTEALAFVIDKLAAINAVIVTLDPEMRQFRKFRVIEQITLHYVILVDAHRFPLLIVNEHKILLDFSHPLLLSKHDFHGLFIQVC